MASSPQICFLFTETIYRFDKVSYSARFSHSVYHFSGWKIDCKVLTPEQCLEYCPTLDIKAGILGGLWLPEDGVANPHLFCHALMTEAQRMGVTVVEHCTIRQVHQTDRKVDRVDTDVGSVECSYFVNCAGFWASHIGELSEPTVKVPIQAVEHYYLHTKPIESLDRNMPVIRDVDANIYVRELDGHVLAGGFETNAKPAYNDGVLPSKTCSLYQENHL